MKIKKILFPTDFSQGAKNALPYAVDMAKTYGAKLYLLHVIYDIATASGLKILATTIDEIYADLHATAKKELERLVMKAKEEIQDVEYVTMRGVPYEEILKFASDNGIELIIIGTHGRKGIDRVLFGSTAERVVRNSSCPVLTVRE